MLVQRTSRLGGFHVDEATIMRPASGHHDVIDWCRQAAEELIEQHRIRGVKRAGAQRMDLARCALQGLRAATREDYFRSLRACSSSRLEPNAGASADYDHGLLQEFRFPPDVRGSDCSAHNSSDHLNPD